MHLIVDYKTLQCKMVSLLIVLYYANHYGGLYAKPAGIDAFTQNRNIIVLTYKVQ